MDPQTADAGEAYLNELGFRSLIEWMPAEVLLSRPEDPLAIIRSILDEKLAEKTQLRLFALRSASADENGRIVIKPRKIATPAPASTSATLTAVSPDPALIKRLATFEKVIEACRLIAMQLGPLGGNAFVVAVYPKHMAEKQIEWQRAHKCSDDDHCQTSMRRTQRGASHAVHLWYRWKRCGDGKAVNLVDAYSDPTFDPSYDLQTGYKTKSMLCVPVRNGGNQIVGVVQVLNKAGATEKEQTFNEVDEEIMGMLAAQAGIALENAKIHTETCLAREHVKDVLSIVQDMHRDLGFISLMFTMSTRIQKLINSDWCTLYIVDRAKNELWTLQGEVNIRVPLNQGISGAAAEANQSINLENAYDDPRFNQEFDQKHGYVTRSVLAMPLRDHVGEVIGVVQLINKMSDPGFFTSDDEELLGTFLQIAGPILETSQSHLPKTTQAKDAGAEFPGKVARAAQDVVEMNVISENDEEES
ncbi:Dual 3',5'-cyclic-amp and-gmp phosphodiesterase, partial [Globisporangium splendens]